MASSRAVGLSPWATCARRRWTPAREADRLQLTELAIIGRRASARRHPEAESTRCGPRGAGDRVGYEPQPRAVRPGIGAERITAVQLVEPAAVGQDHRAENGPSLSVLTVVLDCLAGVALPALCDEAYGLLDVIMIFALGCVNPDPPAIARDSESSTSGSQLSSRRREGPTPRAGER